MRILIADDDVVSRAKLQKIMSTFGACVAVTSGHEAIDAFKNAWAAWIPFDLIALDVLMPGMDGMDALIEIRRLEETKGVAAKHHVKVLMVTSQADRDVVVTCLQAGCDEYIIKPFNLQLVTQKVSELVQGKCIWPRKDSK
nr:response regulator [uncultured Desulfobacter sp.]